MQPRQVARDGQSQAGAWGSVGGAAAEEALEQVRGVRGGNARPLVLDRQAQTLRAARDRKPHSALRLAELDRVVQQVDQDLLEFVRVGRDRGVAAFLFERDRFAFGCGTQEHENLVDERAHRHRGALQPNVPGLQAPPLQQFVDDADQSAAVALDHADVLMLLLGQAARQPVTQVLRRAEDARQRCAQFMRHVGQQRRSQPVELQQFQVRRSQAQVGLAQFRRAFIHLGGQVAVLLFDDDLFAAQFLGQFQQPVLAVDQVVGAPVVDLALPHHHAQQHGGPQHLRPAWRHQQQRQQQHDQRKAHAVGLPGMALLQLQGADGAAAVGLRADVASKEAVVVDPARLHG